VTAPATVGEALRAAAQRLRAGGSRSPRLDAELLLAAALGVDRAELFRAPERALAAEESERFEVFVRRREAREPVAYIRGLRAFRTVELEVTPAVLIPRPETETLVEVALEALAWAGRGVTGGAGPGGAAAPGPFEPLALDMGTGSGCVALALAAENPFVRVVAADVDEAAVAVARGNVARLGLGARVDVVCGDLFEPLPPAQRFDVIAANLPYVPAAEYETLEANVREYEPRVALDGGPDGLDVYRRFIPQAASRLRPGGTLALEVGAGQAAAVADLFAAAGSFAPAQTRADLGGAPRVVWARPAGGGGGGGAAAGGTAAGSGGA
jgi:release factor glutamine methyltransferase